MKLLFFTLLSLFLFVSGVKKSFNGYKVFKIKPKDERVVKLLENLRFNGLGEFWDDYIQVNVESRINVSPDELANFHDYLTVSNIEFQEVIGDFQRMIDEQLKPSGLRDSAGKKNNSKFWTQYQSLYKIYDWLDEINKNYSHVSKIVTRGESVLGKPLKGIVINYNERKHPKLIGVLEGTYHGRDWICPAVLTWVINEFLTSTNPRIRILAEIIEWHIFPIVNPDGYEYSFTNNRIWRKNRSGFNFTTCPRGNNDMSNGVDLNRNFDYHWNAVGITGNPCSNTFAGPAPFSEPETRVIRDYMLKLNSSGKLLYYVVFNAYGQFIILPHTHVTSPETLLKSSYGETFDITSRAAEGMKRRHGTEYQVALSTSSVYPMSGSSFDWVKNATDVRLSLMFQLRDSNSLGFLLPADQIIPTSEEVVDALVEMDLSSRNVGYYKFKAGSTKEVPRFEMVVLSVLFALLGSFIA